MYLFLDRAEGKEKERKRNINVWLPLPCPLLGTWPTTQACALTGNQTSDPLVCRLALNPLSHTSQGNIFYFCLIALVRTSNTMLNRVDEIRHPYLVFDLNVKSTLHFWDKVHFVMVYYHFYILLDLTS